MRGGGQLWQRGAPSALRKLSQPENRTCSILTTVIVTFLLIILVYKFGFRGEFWKISIVVNLKCKMS